MEIKIEVPDNILKDAVYDAIKGQNLDKSIAKMLMDEQAKTSEEGYFVDVVYVKGECKKNTLTGWFLYNLLGELNYERKEGHNYLIKSWYDESVRAVEITRKVGKEGDYYLSDGGSRVLEYKFLGIPNCLDESLLETDIYKSVVEILRQGDVEIYGAGLEYKLMEY